MRRTPAMLLIVLAMLCVAGCSETNLRFAPSEEQKQNSQIGSDLAGVAARDGLPPGSPAAKRLAAAAANDAIYAGPPKTPIDTAPLTPPAVTGAWAVKAKQVDALKLKGQLQAKSQEIATRQMADFVGSVQTKTKVAVADIIQRVQAFSDASKAIAEVSDSIVVPDDAQLSEAEAARMKLLDSAIGKINLAAAANATARPTASDVADTAIAQADRWGTFIQDAFPWLAAIPGVGFGLTTIRGIKRARDAQKAADASAEEAASANSASESLQRSLAAVVKQVDAIKDSPVGQAKLTINGQEVSAAQMMKTILSGQDAQTAADVAAARAVVDTAAGTEQTATQ